ncbi:hypothetical protein SLEP1_g13175 [Rubroshorea leprosula]|uniref:Uncharacterized protein n=1 Tax=Rubroshorea leprosula TaxID=152421 RepID=A0AAV5IKP0_9ROSI|nr:hypothetical protein SLEP1_g13175 [Rubroshorea leprosula]
MGCPDSQEACAHSLKEELRLRCNEVMQVAMEMAVSDSDSHKSKLFFIYQPIANEPSAIGGTQKNCVHRDESFDTLISQVSNGLNIGDKKQNFAAYILSN